MADDYLGTRYFIWNAVACAGAAGLLVSDGFNIHRYKDFGVWYKATSAGGSPDVRLYFQQSYDNTSGNYAVPEGASDINTALTDENPHVANIIPHNMKFFRIVCDGNTANPADTLVSLIFYAQ